MQKKKVAILGSTGSIGRQALEVIRQHRDVLEVVTLTAGRNADLLIEQAIEFLPAYVVIADENQFHTVRENLSRLPVKVLCGVKALSEVAANPDVDLILAAMVGFSGLLPVYEAISHGKEVALANKETLVVAGSLIMDLARQKGSRILPVDSEHSAIFQCLAGEKRSSVEKLILTASGGPFRGMDINQLEKVTRKDALRHPNWCMGSKVTIDSASLMNKGLEVIEASWLFNIQPASIDVVIHPQSIIHSMVQFRDGSIKAQMGLPDMRVPIAYALGYPDRLNLDFPGYNFNECSQLTFEKPDLKVFRNLSIAYNALEKGGNLPCIMNAANEVVVDAFLNDRISFLQMPDVIEKTMSRVLFISDPTLEDLCNSDSEAREMARKVIGNR
ncbi:MAG TPA: 1-deoxy-D-xylulose-5-phosphate reductoisomerase [Bacteroidales bacterium]|jgi:1-deoxy-D-xylulose-5-phosphate reductoisomerase|nr:1-deoxy-D-xylulose-5-phosphate reductoisomerase [Bacteroidales bacterium]